MSVELKNCKNCEKPFNEAYQFCPHCGQKDKDELTLGVLFYNTISNYFSFDARFFKSFIPLMVKPGYLAKKFLEGKRLLYLHPAQMYLFISVIFFFMFSFISRDQAEKLDTVFKKTLEKPKEIDSIAPNETLDSVEIANLLKPLKNNQAFTGMSDSEIKALDSAFVSNNDKANNGLNFDFDEMKVDSLIEAGAPDETIYAAMGLPKDAGTFKKRLYTQVLKFYKQRNGGSLLQAFYDSIPLAMFILLPIFAIMFKLFYWNRGSFAHHLVFSFYFFCFLFTVCSIVLGINFIWDIPNWIDWLVVQSTFFYLFIAVKHFYQQGWFVSFIKTSIISFMFTLMVLPLAAIIVGFVTFLYY